MLKRLAVYIGALHFALLCSVAVLMVGCMTYGPIPQEEFSYATPPGLQPEGVFVVCEGNFMYGNATLSFYVPSTGEVQNEVFARANGMKLGDVAQSMSIHDGMGYVVVNNSGIIFGIDPDTFKIKKVFRGVGSPRYMSFGGTKAYVTSLYEPRIAVLDTSAAAIAGYIETSGHTSTEQMAIAGDLMYVTCWSYDDTVLVVDTRKDEIVHEIKTRPQPRQIVADGYGKVWVLTDGGGNGAAGSSVPVLYRINGATMAIEKEFTFRIGDNPKGLCTDGAGGMIYFLNDDVWEMDALADELPEEPFARSRGTIYYSLGVDPHSGDVYVGDAVDYQQQGTVYRYSSAGELLGSFRVGITPSHFCFK